MTDDHVVVGSAIGHDPGALARAIALHPGMYMGAPVTFERATAYVHGVMMAVLVSGADSPLGDDEHALLKERPEGVRTLEQELADIRRFEPLLGRLFSALPR